ncbi:MAG: MaoC/PaaZ C-terminal domain-containing protein [Myxococcota bacterium]
MDLSLIGREIGPNEIRWTPHDAMLYALGVGAGTRELAFSTENTAGVALRVLPTFVTTVGRAGGAGQVDVLSFGTYGLHQVVHASHKVELYRALAPEGSAFSTVRVAGIWDKRAGALVELETTARDPQTSEVMYRSTASILVLGEGGFGGPRGRVLGGPRHPSREPDHTVSEATHPDQALIYRLSGDDNRLHSDPAVARLAGFDRPILHGLCTFGYAGRALLNAVCDGDPARFRTMEARFGKPGFPGDELTTEIWIEGETALFETRSQRGEALVERGVFTFAKSQG